MGLYKRQITEQAETQRLQDRDEYREQMVERAANGIPTVSFDEWLEKKALLANLFDELKAERDEKRAADDQDWADGPYGRVS